MDKITISCDGAPGCPGPRCDGCIIAALSRPLPVRYRALDFVRRIVRR
jgi:hypothetical protein